MKIEKYRYTIGHNVRDKKGGDKSKIGEKATKQPTDKEIENKFRKRMQKRINITVSIQ